MPLTPGITLGPYEIQAPLGAGGMGEVYKARDTRLDRTVAIKVLLAHVADDPDLRQRFEREAKTISSPNHPHICTLYQRKSRSMRVPYMAGARRIPKSITRLRQSGRGADCWSCLNPRSHRTRICNYKDKDGGVRDPGSEVAHPGQGF